MRRFSQNGVASVLGRSDLLDEEMATSGLDRSSVVGGAGGGRPAEPKAIRLDHVRINYHDRRRRRGAQAVTPAVADVSLDVASKELISIIGPSGCGKSSLLGAVAGLVPFEGTIEIGGKPVDGPGRDRGLVFQAPSLLPWRTVLRNVSYGLELQHDGNDKEIRERSEALIELVGLTGFGDRYPGELSGGMQQRVNMARALATNPTVLLLDEPFSALDAQTRERLQVELLELWARTETAGVFVTHQIDEAVLLADRVVVLGPGPASKVVEIIEVPFGRPRTGSLRADPDFVHLVERLRRLLDVTETK